jgi:hypothetical protein
MNCGLLPFLCLVSNLGREIDERRNADNYSRQLADRG